MTGTEFDVVILGGGSGGYAAARTLVGGGARIAVVDGASELGGLCILRGCMPSKTLLYMAEVLHLARNGTTFGLRIPSARADLKAMHARKRRIIGEFAGYRVKALTAGKFDLIRSRARFLDAHPNSDLAPPAQALLKSLADYATQARLDAAKLATLDRTLTGSLPARLRELKEALEDMVRGVFTEGLWVSAGTTYTLDLTKPRGSRIYDVTIGGKPLDPAATYRICVNNYMASGGDGMNALKNAKGFRQDTGLIDLNVFVDYLGAHSA